MGLRSRLSWIGGPWRRRAPGWWYAHPRIRPSHHDPRVHARMRACIGGKKSKKPMADQSFSVVECWLFCKELQRRIFAAGRSSQPLQGVISCLLGLAVSLVEPLEFEQGHRPTSFDLSASVNIVQHGECIPRMPLME